MALVKFKKTGNIYYGCYEGISDVMIPFICTPYECYDIERDAYLSIYYCRQLDNQHDTWEFPDTTIDLDNIEIYSDYGNGFYWKGMGSESVKMIKDYLMPWDSDIEIIEGQPKWVKDFLKKGNSK